MFEAGIVLLIVTVLVVLPLVQRWREAMQTAELKKIRDPVEASLLVDAAVTESQGEGAAFGAARRVWRSLVRWY
jgi:hypothetical protein